MTELNDYIKTLKEHDSLKDELRSLHLMDTLNKEKALLVNKAPTKEIRELTELLSKCNCEIDLVNLILNDDMDISDDSVKIRVKSQSDLVTVAKKARELLNLVDKSQMKFPDINKFKQELQDANSLRKNCLSLCNELNNILYDIKRNVN
uniref:Uncharacterized protein n=1 Tax=Tetranychus urticae TaxID=32264 RepID=T1JSF7_TETUR